MRRDDDPPWADAPLDYLTQLGQGPDDGFDPGAAALAFAALERPRAALGRYLAHLDALAGETAAFAPADIQARAAALAEVVHMSHGYTGDAQTYDDMQNASLIRVIDRKKGLPVALGILHMSIAHRLGWRMIGLGFPGHFLLCLEDEGQRLPLDPFDNAAVLTAPDMRRILKAVQGEHAELTAACYQPVSDRDVLLRLQNNIKLRRLRGGDIAGALKVAEAMAAFAPAVGDLHREIAMMHMRLENIGDAIRNFERYLALEPNESLRHKAAALLQELRNRLN